MTATAAGMGAAAASCTSGPGGAGETARPLQQPGIFQGTTTLRVFFLRIPDVHYTVRFIESSSLRIFAHFHFTEKNGVLNAAVSFPFVLTRSVF